GSLKKYRLAKPLQNTEYDSISNDEQSTNQRPSRQETISHLTTPCQSILSFGRAKTDEKDK
ncbi:MAG: hypothetical protein II939_12510, partial [Bacteroidales bacterium]|nr:hypothetical protein [Bacteroidales bacterium]